MALFSVLTCGAHRAIGKCATIAHAARICKGIAVALRVAAPYGAYTKIEAAADAECAAGVLRIAVGIEVGIRARMK